MKIFGFFAAVVSEQELSPLKEALKLFMKSFLIRKKLKFKN